MKTRIQRTELFVIMATSKYNAILALAKYLLKTRYHDQDGNVIQNSRQIEQNFDIKQYDKEEAISGRI